MAAKNKAPTLAELRKLARQKLGVIAEVHENIYGELCLFGDVSITVDAPRPQRRALLLLCLRALPTRKDGHGKR